MLTCAVTLLLTGISAWKGTPPIGDTQTDIHFELVRLKGDIPDVGQFSDIICLDSGLCQVAGANGMFFFRVQEGDRYELGDVIMYSLAPRTRVPRAFQLVDIDADERLEVLTRTWGLPVQSIDLYDEHGDAVWQVKPEVSPWLTDESMVVQADADAQLEVIQVYDYRHAARVIEHDGRVTDPIALPSGGKSLWEATAIDVDGDGIDEVLWAIHESVILWSFQQGLLARLDLTGGRAFAFVQQFEEQADPGTHVWRAFRFQGTQMGHSRLELHHVDGSWEFSCGPFVALAAEDAVDSRQASAIRSMDGRLFVRSDLGSYTPDGSDRPRSCGVVKVLDSDGVLLFQGDVRSELLPPLHKVTSLSVREQQRFELEAFVVYGDAIYRLRAERSTP